MLRQISALSTIASTPPRSLSIHDVAEACDLLRKLLGAEDAYILRAGDPYFVRLGADDETPGTYEIKQRGYWMVWKELAAHPLLSAGATSPLSGPAKPRHTSPRSCRPARATQKSSSSAGRGRTA